MTAAVIVPVKVQSLNDNLRGSLKARIRRKAVQRTAVAWALSTTKRPPLPVTVRLVRIGPRRLDDDNVIGGMKAIRDAVADWLGVNDGDRSRVRFEYEQEKGAPREYACRIEFA